MTRPAGDERKKEEECVDSEEERDDGRRPAGDERREALGARVGELEEGRGNSNDQFICSYVRMTKLMQHLLLLSYDGRPYLQPLWINSEKYTSH